MRDAEEYTVSVRRENFDDELLYVARVEELPDVEEYADSYDMARTLALDTIRTTQSIFAEKNIPFPAPKQFNQHIEVSGRVTLRLPKNIHAECLSGAERNGVSLNTYLISRLSKTDIDQQLHDFNKLVAALDNSVKHLQYGRIFSNELHTHNLNKVAATKVFESTVRLSSREDEESSHKIRAFLSSSMSKMNPC